MERKEVSTLFWLALMQGGKHRLAPVQGGQFMLVPAPLLCRELKAHSSPLVPKELSAAINQLVAEPGWSSIQRNYGGVLGTEKGCERLLYLLCGTISCLIFQLCNCSKDSTSFTILPCLSLSNRPVSIHWQMWLTDLAL